MSITIRKRILRSLARWVLPSIAGSRVVVGTVSVLQFQVLDTHGWTLLCLYVFCVAVRWQRNWIQNEPVSTEKFWPLRSKLFLLASSFPHPHYWIRQLTWERKISLHTYEFTYDDACSVEHAMHDDDYIWYIIHSKEARRTPRRFEDLRLDFARNQIRRPAKREFTNYIITNVY